MKTMRDLINLTDSVFGTEVTQEAKLTEYKKEKTKESASGGATGAGAVATSAAPLGRKKGIGRK